MASSSPHDEEHSSGDVAGQATSRGKRESPNSKHDRFKEKNRLAQKRFRAKQKNMMETMKTSVADLEQQVSRFHGCVGCCAAAPTELLVVSPVVSHSVPPKVHSSTNKT